MNGRWAGRKAYNKPGAWQAAENKKKKKIGKIGQIGQATNRQKNNGQT